MGVPGGMGRACVSRHISPKKSGYRMASSRASGWLCRLGKGALGTVSILGTVGGYGEGWDEDGCAGVAVVVHVLFDRRLRMQDTPKTRRM